MKYEDIVFAWNAQHVNNGPLAGDGRTWDKISDRERIEFALMMATRQEQPIAKIVCGTGGGCSLEFTNGADSLDYAGCDVYLRPPIAQEPHPPTRHCMCDDCAPSFEPTPDGLAPAVTDAMALAFHSAITDSSIGQGEVDEIKTGLRAALCAAKPVENQEPVAWHTDDYLSDKSATTYDHDVMKQWELKGWPITAHYTAPQPCPECEERKTTALNYISLTFEFEQLQSKYKKLKAERDELSKKLKYSSMAATAEAHRCDELAAQVEKMNGVIKAAYEIAVDHDDQLPFDWAVYCEMLYQAMQDGDLSTGILNRVRAEALDAKRYQWLRSSSVGPAQIWELLSDDCVPPVMTLKMLGDLDAAIDRALAADMEAGKC